MAAASMDFSANKMTHEVTLDMGDRQIVLVASLARLADFQRRIETEGLGETIRRIRLLDVRALLAGLVALSGSKIPDEFDDMHASVPALQVIAGALATTLTLGMPDAGSDQGNAEAPDS